MSNPFRYFKTSPELNRLAVMMYVRFPLALRNVEDLLHEHGIDISQGRVRFWANNTKGVPIHCSNSMFPSFFNG